MSPATPAAADAAQLPAPQAQPANEDVNAELKRALLKKVAQLTKVVVHLNTRNDESESRYERLRQGFEEEIRTIMQDAVLKVAGYRKQLNELSDPELLRRSADQQAEAWRSSREEARRELEVLRSEVAGRQERLIEQGRSKLCESAAGLRRLTAGMRASLNAFREAVGHSRAEFERRDNELREKSEEELRGVAAEHKRRLDDLRSAHAREVEGLNSAREQALSHLSRLHESELSALRMQALQKRRERVHRLEQEFNEERRMLEQLIAQMGFELEQQQRDTADVEGSSGSMQQQIDTMRAALEEMTKRVSLAEAETVRVRDEAAQKEVEVAALQSEVTVLQVRQRAAGIGVAPPPPNSVRGSAGIGAAAAASSAHTGTRAAAAELSEELRSAITNAKQVEAELGQTDAELAELDDELTEREKQVEILEVEVEEEQLRTHQLEVRILEKEASLKA